MVSHKYFLSRGLSMAQRIECADSHFRFETAYARASYHAAIRDSSGLTLWRAQAAGIDYSILLHHADDLPQEGLTSISLVAGGNVLHVIALTWVPEQLLRPRADAAAWLMFISRSQSAHQDLAGVADFRTAFPQNAPSYFCMAAALGVAAAHAQTRIVGIDGKMQVAFEPRLAAGFRRSYGDFWHSYGGVADSWQGHVIPVPAQLPALTAIPSKHRSRARARRAHWTAITQSSNDALRPHLVPADSRPFLSARPPSSSSMPQQVLMRSLPSTILSLLTYLPAGVI